MKHTFSFISLILIGLCTLVFGQEFKFDYLTIQKGLTNSFVYTIAQDDKGYLYLGTAEGIGIYNGRSVSMITKGNGISDNYITASFKDSKGNIWFGHNQGGSSVLYNRKFEKVHPGVGINSTINSIAEDKYGRIWFVAQGYGLYCTDDNAQFLFYNKLSPGSLFYSLYIDEDDFFFIGTDKGVEMYKYYEDEEGKILSKTQNINGIPKDQVVSISKIDDHHILIATLNSGLYTITYEKNTNYKTTPVVLNNFNEHITITHANYNQGYYWISTLQHGLLKIIKQNSAFQVYEQFCERTGLKTNSVNYSFIDRENVIRIATFGEGMASKEDDIFSFYFIDKKKLNPFTQIKASSLHLYLAKKGALMCINKQTSELVWELNGQNGIPSDEITQFVFDKDSNIVISTTLNGIYFVDITTKRARPLPLSPDILAQTVADLTFKDGFLYVGTLNGVYQYDLATGGIRIFNITSGLPHNSIGALYKWNNYQLLIGTNSAFISVLEDNEITNYPINPDNQVVNVNMFATDQNSQLWFSTAGNGVYHFDGNTCYNLNSTDGLLSNYCNGLSFDNNGLIWVTHYTGLSQINPENGQIKTFDDHYGLDFRFLRTSLSKFENEIWFGTENGLVKYSSNKLRTNTVPPITSLLSVQVNGVDTLNSSSVILPYGEYEITFEFIGLSLRKSGGVNYQTFLEGYDKDWSKLGADNIAKYPKVVDGEYTFYVKSFNADGIEGNTIAYKITIASPYWKKWWFYVFLFGVMIILFIIVVKWREKSLLRYQEKLESELALRTNEVVEQKNKIEEINKDLTDSINYAQRIQNSILPTSSDIKALFPESFVFFQPKDVVSGDFYWCAQYGTKKVMVCADCTGHGVPGGFMSMISHILLRESVNDESLENPALILHEINRNINEVLHQSDEFTSNKDGLDIAVTIADTTSGILKFAGAIRPMYLYRNGIRNIIQGNRYSLGGINATKQFDTKEIEVKKGDVVYLFSDGYPDQFGGDNSTIKGKMANNRKVKKMKIILFNELLDQISLMNMEQQRIEIELFFNNWKGEHAQMDDVLVIGYKIE
jgi:ligand-binding sensor domain-containing protein/serine phosphatase RsbU (regulator of sigma subunit)